MEKIQTAFNKAISGYAEKFPEGVKNFQAACFEHKDSILGLAYVYPIEEE